MRYYIFIPEKNEWSDIAYTEQELQVYPGINGQTLLCEQMSKRTLYYGQLLQQGTMQAPPPLPTTSQTLSVDNQSLSRIISILNAANIERAELNRYAHVVGKYVIFFILMPWLASLGGGLGYFVGMSVSIPAAIISTFVGGSIGILLSIIIAGSK